MRTGFVYRPRIAWILVALGTAVTAVVAQPEKGPPKALVQYVQDAKSRGLTDAKIRRDAVAVGWAPSVIDRALSLAKKRPPPPTTSAAPVRSDAVGASAPATSPGRATLTSAPEQVQSGAAIPGQNQTAPPPNAAPQPLFSDDYLIGAGDALQISVWKEPDVSVPSVIVRPDGMITVPLIKEVAVARLTPREAEKVIAAGLAKYIKAPNVTVVVAASNSKKIYVIGEVRMEGPLPYTYRMTVIQALSEAGGLTQYAKRKKIYIVRNEGGRDYRLDFNYEEVIKGERMEQNLELLPGDTVVIPR
jgi:polysaccharide biosynthesis/export protein